jgi:hypothetical protein
MEWMDPTKLTKQMEWTDPSKLAKQVFDFQKATFNNSFEALVLLQNQAERIAASLEHSLGMPKQGQKFIDDCIKAFNQGRDEYKKMITQGLDNMETFFAVPKKEEAAKEPEIKAAETAKAPAKAAQKEESAKEPKPAAKSA